MAQLLLTWAILVLAAGSRSFALGPQPIDLGRKYSKGDGILFYGNVVGPFTNPTETYQYYDLPFCQPSTGKAYKRPSVGEALKGVRLVTTPYAIKFRVDVDNQVLCNKTLKTDDLHKFRNAVKSQLYFQMFLDDLPVWGFVGQTAKDVKTGTDQHILFTNLMFDVSYNGDRVIDITAFNAAPVNISEADTLDVPFTYSVHWRETPNTFERRWDRFVSSAQYTYKHRWPAVIQSLATLLLLGGVVASALMRFIRRDFVRYSRAEDETGSWRQQLLEETAAEAEEETGWKWLDGDVFRPPPNANLLSAMVGVGTQMLAVAACVPFLLMSDMAYQFYSGTGLSRTVWLYALTAGTASYVGGVWYKMLGGGDWRSNVLLCAALCWAPPAAYCVFRETVAAAYGTTSPAWAGGALITGLIWALVALPLTLLGGIAARSSTAALHAPCRTHSIPRDIPRLPWYVTAVPQMLIAGVLPFSAIYTELYWTLASIWGFRIHLSIGILILLLAILNIVTALVAIALTYFQLAAQDHRWWWRSFLCGSSTGIYVYGYCFYYYMARTQMSGFMQAS